MVTTSTHTKDRNIAAFGTLLVHTAVILLAVLFLKNCSGGGGGGNGGFGNGLMSLEVAGLGNPEDGFGDHPSSPQSTPQPAAKDEMPALTDDNSEVAAPTVNADKPKKPQTQNPKPVKPVEPQKPKPSNELNNALGSLGKGNTSGSGNQGDPNGTIDGKGAVNGGGSAGTGGGTGGGTGTGNGPGTGPGSGPGIGFVSDLSGRNMSTNPTLSEKPSEEGTVVVDIWVTSDGTVARAEPNSKKSNTSSAQLYALAVKAAKSARFNVSPGSAQQKGTITIKFVLK